MLESSIFWEDLIFFVFWVEIVLGVLEINFFFEFFGSSIGKFFVYVFLVYKGVILVIREICVISSFLIISCYILLVN